jgi:hypothetical protein
MEMIALQKGIKSISVQKRLRVSTHFKLPLTSNWSHLLVRGSVNLRWFE